MWTSLFAADVHLLLGSRPARDRRCLGGSVGSGRSSRRGRGYLYCAEGREHLLVEGASLSLYIYIFKESIYIYIKRVYIYIKIVYI